ncbi:MAG: hypothetical protein WBW62_05665 [Solirubrobacterales bacterium]
METSISEWSDLFVAAAGASAALAGLVFVAVSINLESIIKGDGLPERSLVTLMLLIGVLLVSLFGLIPGQGEESLGLELFVQSVLWFIAITIFTFKSLSTGGMQPAWYVGRFVPTLFGTVPYIVGSLMLMSGDTAGLNWIFAGMIGAIVAAVMNAWVLLVEILR